MCLGMCSVGNILQLSGNVIDSNMKYHPTHLNFIQRGRSIAIRFRSNLSGSAVSLIRSWHLPDRTAHRNVCVHMCVHIKSQKKSSAVKLNLFYLCLSQARVLATIGVTRGLGDHNLKVHDSNIYIKPFLSCCPEVGSALCFSSLYVLLQGEQRGSDIIHM